MGGSSFFGGAGANGASGGNGIPGAPNTGGGGGGAGGQVVSNSASGSGGGSGGYVDAIIIPTAAQVFAYVVGVGGTAQLAGTSGYAGGAGGSGYIEVTEFYSNLALGTTASVAPNTMFSGPTSGASAVPAFRTLVSADLPGCYFKAIMGATVCSSSTPTKVVFASISHDSDSAGSMGTSLWTCPAGKGGYYSILGNIQFGSATSVASAPIALTPYINSANSEIHYVYVPAFTGQVGAGSTWFVFLSPGDTVGFAAQASAAAGATTNGGTFSIIKQLGN